MRFTPDPGAAAKVAVSTASEIQSAEPARLPRGTTNYPGAMFTARPLSR